MSNFSTRKSILLTAFALGSMTMYAQSNKADTTRISDVVVTGTRHAVDVRHLPFTVNVVDRKTLTENEQPAILPTLTQQIPGLFVTGRGVMGYGVSGGAAGGIMMRGVSGSTGQMMVLIDGHPQYNGIYGHPIADSYQTMMAERVEVLRGPASMLYGSNAMGGVINIVTRGMKHDGVVTNLNVGAGSYGTFQAEAANQLKSGRFSSTIAAQYNRSDNHRPRMGFEQYGAHLKLGYELSEHWNAFLDGEVNHFNAEQPGSKTSPLFSAKQWITRGSVSAGVENHYEKTSGGLSVYTNFGRHKIDDGTGDLSKPTARYFRSKDNLAGVSWYQSARLFEGNRTTVGIDYQHIYGRAYYTSKETGKTLETPNKQSGKSHRNEVAGYVDFRQDLTSWMTVDAGIRVDHHNISGTEWIPQAGVVFRPMESSALKAMVSKGFRNPTMREMYLYPPSNTDLEPERMMNYELSWKHQVSRLNYGLNLYYLKGDNMIQTLMGESGPRNVNTGEIENYGLELEGKYRINRHWSVNTNHSFLHMENKIVAAPQYKGFVGGNFTQGKWSVVAGLQYINGLYTAVGENEKKEDFWLLNTTVNYSVLDNLRFWVKGENLLAKRYEINAGYPMPKATFMGGVNFRF